MEGGAMNAAKLAVFDAIVHYKARADDSILARSP
jgi:hypothetical protein